MRVIVVGAGAWGLPTATRLAERGHSVTLLERWGVGNPLASSFGASRVWRLTDRRASRVELGIYGHEALQRASRAAGEPVFATTGVLWRDIDDGDAAAAALSAHSVPFTRVAADRVGEYFPGLKPTEHDAIWCESGGVVRADRSLNAELRRFRSAGGRYLLGKTATQIVPDDRAPGVLCDDRTELTADVVIVAAGAANKALLDPILPISLPFEQVYEQVVHFGSPDTIGLTEKYPSLMDGVTDDRPGLYAMSTPGVGVKVGLEIPAKPYDPNDVDRTPSPEITRLTLERVREHFGGVVPEVIDAQICHWTDNTADGDFVIDRLPGSVIMAGGDAGEGFKYTAVIGEILADLAEGKEPVVDLAPYRVSRFVEMLG